MPSPRSTPTVTVNRARLEARIEELGRIGVHPEGGLDRGVYDDSWTEAMELVAGWLSGAGLKVRRDAVGNLFGRLEGYASDRVIMTGSHIDTVPQGGAYDGGLGVQAAVEAVVSIAEQLGPQPTALEVFVCAEEEGSRWPCDFWGARALVGSIGADEPHELLALDGSEITIADGMRRHGLDPELIPTAARDDIDVFVELHIEQGRVLEDAGQQIGIVHTINGKVHLEAVIEGRSDHAGGTPMGLRHDALAAGADIALRVEALAKRLGDPAVATVGSLVPRPGAINVIAHRCELTIDARHPDPVQLTALQDGIHSLLAEVAQDRSVEVSVVREARHEPQPMDAQVTSVLTEAAAARNGRPPLLMVSGAGHDSQIISQHVPTGMIFVPSVDGLSHTPHEYTRIEDSVAGVEVLVDALLSLARGRQ